MRNTLHIEPTTRCTLACPACPRTTWHELLGKPIDKIDFDYKLLNQFLDCESGNNIEILNLCGDYGDAIYYPQLFNFIKDFRHKKFEIHTNGSYRPRNWWKQLNSLLTEDDVVVFAVDGLGDDNARYRVNSNWDQVVHAIDELKNGPAKLECQTIIFSFNYTKLDQIQEWAESNNMKWYSWRTHRFGKADLEPPQEYTEEKEFYREEYNNADVIEIEPDCFNQSVVTSDNYYLPCDWIRNPLTFYRTELFNNKQRWLNRLDMRNNNLDQVNNVLAEWVDDVKQKGLEGKAEVLCKMKCRKCQ